MLDKTFVAIKSNVLFVSDSNCYELVSVLLFVSSSEFLVDSERVLSTKVHRFDSLNTCLLGLLLMHFLLDSHGALLLNELS